MPLDSRARISISGLTCFPTVSSRFFVFVRSSALLPLWFDVGFRRQEIGLVLLDWPNVSRLSPKEFFPIEPLRTFARQGNMAKRRVKRLSLSVAQHNVGGVLLHAREASLTAQLILSFGLVVVRDEPLIKLFEANANIKILSLDQKELQIVLLFDADAAPFAGAVLHLEKVVGEVIHQVGPRIFHGHARPGRYVGIKAVESALSDLQKHWLERSKNRKDAISIHWCLLVVA